MSQGSVDLVGSAGVARPEEPGTPDRGVVGTRGEALAEPGLGVVELARPAVEVRQAQPDAVVVGGVAGRLFEHEAGAFHGHRLEFEEPQVAEHAHRVGCEGQLLPQELPRLVAAVLESQGALEHLAGLRRLPADVGHRPPEQVLGPGELAAFQQDGCDPCGGKPGEWRSGTDPLPGLDRVVEPPPLLLAESQPVRRLVVTRPMGKHPNEVRARRREVAPCHGRPARIQHRSGAPLPVGPPAPQAGHGDGGEDESGFREPTHQATPTEQTARMASLPAAGGTVIDILPCRGERLSRHRPSLARRVNDRAVTSVESWRMNERGVNGQAVGREEGSRAVGPDDPEKVNRRGGAEAEVECGVGRGEDAPSPADGVDATPAAGLQLDPRANRLAVGREADQAERHPVCHAPAFVDENAERAVDGGHDQVEVAVAVEVAGGHRPARAEPLSSSPQVAVTSSNRSSPWFRRRSGGWS